MKNILSWIAVFVIGIVLGYLFDGFLSVRKELKALIK